MKWHYIFSSPNKYSLTSTTVSMLCLKVSIPDSHCSSARSITCYHGPCDLLVLNALSLISLFRHTETSMWGCHMCQQQAFIYAKIFTLWDLSDWNAFFFFFCHFFSFLLLNHPSDFISVTLSQGIFPQSPLWEPCISFS